MIIAVFFIVHFFQTSGIGLFPRFQFLDAGVEAVQRREAVAYNGVCIVVEDGGWLTYVFFMLLTTFSVFQHLLFCNAYGPHIFQVEVAQLAATYLSQSLFLCMSAIAVLTLS